ncbi:hypothetical protein ABID56_001132 [Alkalibacillus flavidus]|uniref:HIRAN domain-containing protein n=1 Tax=Alkalibacillus flavidus TaxID=546021 RepID=A0ABV2KV97_9BACI
MYYHIGTLTYHGERYTFEYSHKSESPRNVHEAIRQGYRLHPAFPNLNKTYESEKLFTTFNRRIPDHTRIGFEEILEELSLSEDADRMDVLRETRGVLSGDPYSFEEPLRLHEDILHSNFYINGMRHNNKLPENWSEFLKPGDQLVPEVDEDNSFDQYAVRIMNTEGLFIGYVPGIYAQAVHSLLKNNENVVLEVKKVRSYYTPQWWVKVKLTATVNFDKKGYEYRTKLNSCIFKDTA